MFLKLLQKKSIDWRWSWYKLNRLCLHWAIARYAHFTFVSRPETLIAF